MIAKGTTGSDFAGALAHLLSPDKRWTLLHSQELSARLSHEGAEAVEREMVACAALSSRCMKPVYRLSLFWAPEDSPSPAQVDATARRFLGDLGLGEHQIVVVRHHNPTRVIVHIVANRVHPGTGKAWKPPHWQWLSALSRRVEREMGWRVVSSERAPDQARPTAREQDEERKSGAASLAQLMNAACGASLSSAGSWPDFERILRMHGYAAELGADGGLVFTDGERQAPAALVRPGLRRSQLEDRFGHSFAAHRAELRAAAPR